MCPGDKTCSCTISRMAPSARGVPSLEKKDRQRRVVEIGDLSLIPVSEGCGLSGWVSE